MRAHDCQHRRTNVRWQCRPDVSDFTELEPQPRFVWTYVWTIRLCAYVIPANLGGSNPPGSITLTLLSGLLPHPRLSKCGAFSLALPPGRTPTPAQSTGTGSKTAAGPVRIWSIRPCLASLQRSAASRMSRARQAKRLTARALGERTPLACRAALLCASLRSLLNGNGGH